MVPKFSDNRMYTCLRDVEDYWPSEPVHRGKFEIVTSVSMLKTFHVNSLIRNN